MGERRIWRSRRRKKRRIARRACSRLTGERGEPQPQEWKVVLSDPDARGGIREVVASGDVIVSQRTPLKGYAGGGSEPAIALTRLNLDSDRAFEIANKQAIAKKVSFSWVDYSCGQTLQGAPRCGFFGFTTAWG